MDKRLEAKLATKERRQKMSCKVFQLKIDKSHLSDKTLNHLTKLFIEAKWFYNFCLGSPKLSEVDTKIKKVPVKVKNVFETRPLTALSSQMKQSIHQGIFDNLKGLKVSKTKGRKVGALKFKSWEDSVPLKQYNNTYYIDGNRIRIQGLMCWLRVNGTEQIPEGAEFANANLVNEAGDFWLHVTCYIPKISKLTEHNKGKVTGSDSGCTNQITLSQGIKVQFEVQPSKRQKKLDHEAAIPKKEKHSKNRKKVLVKRQKEFLHQDNQKKDIKNKVVHVVTTEFEIVITQKENVKGWQKGGHGKKVHNTGIGGLTSALQKKAHTPVIVDRFYPSTQTCSQCGHRQKKKVELWDRTFVCEKCGCVLERDWNSSMDMEVEGLRMLNIPTERRNCRTFKPAENEASIHLHEEFNKIPHVRASFVR